jgi:hypothetical protein
MYDNLSLLPWPLRVRTGSRLCCLSLFIVALL